MTKIALMFPGQGTQYVGMGKNLCSKYEVANRTFEEANEFLGFDLKKLCFEGDIESLTKTENAQPAILTTSVAHYRVYMHEFGIEPYVAAGHSLGEISALTCSGAISFGDAVKIVRARGRFMQEAAEQKSGSMCAVSGIDREVINRECIRHSKDGSFVGISNYNSFDQVVISGQDEALEKTRISLSEMGAIIMPLKVSAPFHTPMMLPASEKFRDELKKYTFHESNWPVISNINALPYQGSHTIEETLTCQMIKPVLWEATVKYMVNEGASAAIELGPKAVLKKIMKRNAENIRAFSFDLDEDYLAINKLFEDNNLENLGVSINKSFNSQNSVITKCLAIAICTQNRNWNSAEYRNGVIEPYRKIQEIQETVEKSGVEPTEEQIYEALSMLKSVLDTKLVPNGEKVERFNEIFKEFEMQEMFNDFIASETY